MKSEHRANEPGQRPDGRHSMIAAVAAVAILAGAAGYGIGMITGQPADPGDRTWIEDASEAEGLWPDQVIARQFRGLDVAMIEIDHRYAELFFAAQDGNWQYAEHQVEHMARAMDLALERRPARGESARAFFYPALDRLEAAVEAEDADAFATELDAFRVDCNACHAAEDEPAFWVGTPTQRRTTISAPGAEETT